MLTTVDALTQNLPTRDEKDLLGIAQVPADALYGIHTLRAVQNFPISGRPVHPALIRVFGYVKGACAQTNASLGIWKDDKEKSRAILKACHEMVEGLLDAHMVVDAMQGGAGTSTNMNANEVIANRALQLLGDNLGNYTHISPLDDINLHQSTNDAYPTALKIATIVLLRELTAELTSLQSAFRAKERQYANIVKIGRTQLQDAVLTTLGREMKAYAEALGRDVTRLGACEEKLGVVNLGGTAIGTGIVALPAYISHVVAILQEMTDLPITQADDLIDNTQNADVFVEVSGVLKTCAASLIKISSDLRLLSSGPDGGIGEIILPARQAGSSIMPGKINPVIPEVMTQAALRMIGYDHGITMAASMGNLELNAFLPLIADSLLDGISLMTHAITSLRIYCVDGITANKERCRANAESPTAILTSLVSVIGYSKAVKIVHNAQEQGKSVKQTVLDDGHMREESFNELLSPASVLQLITPNITREAC